jgi:hypothetical protein
MRARSIDRRLGAGVDTVADMFDAKPFILGGGFAAAEQPA